MKKLFLLVFLTLPIFVQMGRAVPAYPYPITVTQADGSELTIRIHGDEHFGYYTTEDGYLLKVNAQGSYEYATFTDGSFQTLGVIARNKRTAEERVLLKTLQPNSISEEQRIEFQQSRAKAVRPKLAINPLRGSAKGLVILMNFSDLAFTVPNAQQSFHNLLNQTGYSGNGATGSAKEYFSQSSNGLFTPVFDVVGPFTASQSMAYYGAPSGGNHDSNVALLIREACGAAEAAGVDFSQYCTLDPNIIDNVFVFYAGHNQAEGGGENTIWPHRSIVPGSIPYGTKILRDYACTSEYRGSAGTSMAGVGTFCHEFSHVLGLPDLYPTNNEQHYTVGTWDIMASGPYNNAGRTPPSFSSHERFYLSYLTPTLLDTADLYTLEPLLTHNQAYIIASGNTHNLDPLNPSPSEFFMLENRQRVGWDAPAGALPGVGMLITKINYSSSAWANNTPNNNADNLRVEIQSADENYKYSSSSRNTFPGTSNITYFGPRLNSGETLANSAVTGIEEVDGTISFCFNGCGDNYANIKLFPQNTFFRTVANTPSSASPMGVTGAHLSDPVILSFSGTNSNAFQMHLSTDLTNTWSRTLTLTPDAIDSTLLETVEIRYNPSSPSFFAKHTASFIARSGNAMAQVGFSGQSTNKIEITIPEALEASKISPYAYQANWKPQIKTSAQVDTVVGYYFTSYMKGGSTTDTETFDRFGEGILPGWQHNFTTFTSNNPLSSPKAVLFTSLIDTVWSCYYPTGVSQIQFWARSEDFREIGEFVVDGYNGTQWVAIDTFAIDLRLTGVLKSYTLDPAENFRSFRFYPNIISTRGMAFDDFSATYPLTVVNNRIFIDVNTAKNSVDTASIRVTGLMPSSDYYYRVQATNQDMLERYENVTDFSREVYVATKYGEDPASRTLTATFDPSGNLIVAVNDLDMTNYKGVKLDLYVFTVDGKLVSRIPYADYVADPGHVVIEGLFNQSTYIVSLGVGNKGKYVKVYKTK